MQGTFEDPEYGICLNCSEHFNCRSCNQDGCLVCDNGYLPFNGRCVNWLFKKLEKNNIISIILMGCTHSQQFLEVNLD